MKISFFVDDLSGNAIVRAAPLIDAIQLEGYAVEVLGFLIASPQVYAPYRDRFNYKTIAISGTLRGRIRQLARLGTGEIIYACKPLVTSFLPALWASGFGFRRPLLLDVEDDELWLQGPEIPPGGRPSPGQKLSSWWQLRRTLALHPFTHLACDVSVVSRRLQRRYGGVIVLHGPDERAFDPDRPELDRVACRRRLGLSEGKLLVLFAGVPHRHKGLDVLVEALADPRLAAMYLVLVGVPENPAFNEAQRRLGARVIRLGLIPNRDMPVLLAAVDIVPTPQMDNDFTQAQIPAKLLEAMAMARCVVASRVSDLPLLLGENENEPRGWLHQPGDPRSLAECLVEVLRQPAEALKRGRAAREYYLLNASAQSIRQRLRPLLQRAAARGLPREA